MVRPSRRAAFACHIGGRAEQQDRAACFTSRDGRNHLLVVADGMGGHQGGELASHVVMEVAERAWSALDGLPHAPASFLERVCQQAHAEIRLAGQARGLRPCSTLAALLVSPHRAWWSYVGDSRIYVFRDGRPLWRTEDHTVVQQLVRSGRISEAEVVDHPDRNKLLRGLGGDEPLRATHGQLRIDAATGFVLCTDGFWATTSTEEMAPLLSASDLAAACTNAVAAAAQRGGPESDNVTIAVLQPERRTQAVNHRQLWPLYGALGLALLLLFSRFFN
ncbi:PP2C family protein-serine/threonine phosphatase [Azoarcus olearius]|uniref:Phosphoprotein phosphatase n=1 Tax=Azoarcus sp. (strain BH72) TaxID=418699 RepID=A1K3V8_AZOSB|nr:protein phosphatase 2C domain-containing protein [Azoarcus olearius]ANQ84035.1 putative phosphoprotein phosphatase [Azoarcus olearius]CAL93513.1 putative phosphoprotein phosphatase [Azoarcus olearius]